MARKVEALERIARLLNDNELLDMSDMGTAECIDTIADGLTSFLDDVQSTIISFNARIKALEDKG